MPQPPKPSEYYSSAARRAHLVLQLHFDFASEERLLAFWRRLGKYSSVDELRAKLSWPHLSLVSSDSEASQPDLAALEELCARQRKLNLTAIFWGTWGASTGALFAGIAPTTELLELHRALTRFAIERGWKLDPYFLPERFVPHCSMMVGREFDEVLEGAAMLSDTVFPFELSSDALDVVHYYPVELLRRCPLS